jgi:hypothetical protein
MKYILLISFLFSASISYGQNPDSVWKLKDGRIVTRTVCQVITTNPPQYEYCNDTTEKPPEGQQDWIAGEPTGQTIELPNLNKLEQRITALEKKIDSLERRPIIYLDTTSIERPSIWVKDDKRGFNVKLFPPVK